jgi:hypothetical protein
MSLDFIGCQRLIPFASFLGFQQVLFQGLKAPATAIITIVMGFFTICMCKEWRGGRSIRSLSVYRHGYHYSSNVQSGSNHSQVGPSIHHPPPSEQATHRITREIHHRFRRVCPISITFEFNTILIKFHSPGIDALRGGFGTVGSIIRARSMRKSIASGTGPMSPAVEQWRLRHPYAAEEGNNSTGNIFMPDMKRHQLYDAPVPRQSTISTSTQGESATSAPGQSAKRQTHKSIKFGNEDTRHFYPSPGLPGEARHDSVKVAPYTQPMYAASDADGSSIFAGQQSSSPPQIRPLPQVNDPFQDRLRDRSGSTDSEDERQRGEEAPLTATLHKPYPHSGDRDEDAEERYGLVGSQNDSVRLVGQRRK